jgi:hypothetical protein
LLAQKLMAIAAAMDSCPLNPEHHCTCAQRIRAVAELIEERERQIVPEHLRGPAAPVVSLADRRRAL